MKSKTKIIDRGFAEAIEQAGFAKGKSFVEMGILSKDGGEDRGGITLAELGSVHEFGTIDKRIPSRSWMRSTNAEKKEEIFKLSFKLLSKVALGEMKIKKALSLIGLKVSSLYTAKIVAIKNPKLKVEPRKRGGSNPLVDTGRLKNSQSYSVKLKKRKVQT